MQFRSIILPCILLISWLNIAQSAQNNTFSDIIQNEAANQKSKYFEDQFYIGLTYNILVQKPDLVTQRNLSYGLQGGFIKDIPLNTIGKLAIGIGLGYGVYSYYSNLRATQNSTTYDYRVIEDANSFNRNKLETHTFELPFELRWRDSTPITYKFWRVYAGIKFAYVIGGRSKYVSDLEKNSFYNLDLQKLQYGLTFNFGYNTFNIHLYYALNNLLSDEAMLNDERIAIKPLRIGLIFYIL